MKTERQVFTNDIVAISSDCQHAKAGALGLVIGLFENGECAIHLRSCDKTVRLFNHQFKILCSRENPMDGDIKPPFEIEQHIAHSFPHLEPHSFDSPSGPPEPWPQEMIDPWSSSQEARQMEIH